MRPRVTEVFQSRFLRPRLNLLWPPLILFFVFLLFRHSDFHTTNDATIALVSVAPVAIGCVGILLWLGRPARIPLAVIATAYVWGAGPAAFFASIVSNFIDGQNVFVAANGNLTEIFPTTWTSVPLTEELFKALGVLLLLLLARKQFDGPLVGLLLGTFVGCGFAFTEDIGYAADALNSSGPSEMWSGLLFRAAMSFNHASFTMLFGLALGYATRYAASRRALTCYLAGGLLLAFVVHALLNGLKTWAFVSLPFLLEVTVGWMLVSLALVLWVRRTESVKLRAHLKSARAQQTPTSGEPTRLPSKSHRRKVLSLETRLWFAHKRNAQAIVFFHGRGPQEIRQELDLIAE